MLRLFMAHGMGVTTSEANDWVGKGCFGLSDAFVQWKLATSTVSDDGGLEERGWIRIRMTDWDAAVED